jgi:hypothetical protein
MSFFSKSKLFTSILSSCLLMESLSAVDDTWTGEAAPPSQSWQTTGNWSLNATPTSSNNVILDDNGVTISLDESPSFGSTLLFTGASSFILTNGTLSLAGTGSVINLEGTLTQILDIDVILSNNATISLRGTGTLLSGSTVYGTGTSLEVIGVGELINSGNFGFGNGVVCQNIISSASITNSGVWAEGISGSFTLNQGPFTNTGTISAPLFYITGGSLSNASFSINFSSKLDNFLISKKLYNFCLLFSSINQFIILPLNKFIIYSRSITSSSVNP